MAKSGYTTKLASTLKALQDNSELCDVTINVGKKSFPAHKAVLAASSDYFRAMFSHGFKESNANEITIEGNPDIFDVLLSYAYTGAMRIVPKDALDIIKMACYMQFNGIHSYISKVLNLSSFTCSSEMIKMTDALKIYHLVQDHVELKDVTEEVMRYLCENIGELTQTEDILDTVSKPFMDVILSQKNLFCVKGEQLILDLVITWLKNDWASRHVHAFALLQEVHLGLVPAENLEELLEDDKILEIRKCQELIKKVLKLQEMGGKFNIQLCIDNPKLFGARAACTVPIALCKDEAIADFPRNNGAIIDRDIFKWRYFDRATKQWKSLHNRLAQPPQKVATLFVVGGTMYAVGGREDWDDGPGEPAICMAKHLFWFDAEENRWNELPAMRTPRDVDNILMVYLNGFMYTISCTDHTFNNAAERYDIANKTWETLTPISLPPDSNFASPVVYDGRILVYGRYRDSRTLDHQHTILAYNPDLDAWHTAYQKCMGDVESWIIFPVLFYYNGVLYRVMFLRPAENRERIELQIPKVNVMNVRISRNEVRVTEGEKVSQDLIPVNTMGAFRVQDEVFLNVNGLVEKTDLKIAEGQKADVDLSPWKKFPLPQYQTYFVNSNIVNYSLDKKFLD